MEDKEIIGLFWQREQSALKELADKYGHYCNAVAFNILKNSADTEECVNDAYFSVWNTVPPKKPEALGAYLAKIVRNKALSIYNKAHSAKRGFGEEPLPIEELKDLVSGDCVHQQADKNELLAAINGFLEALPKKTRLIFVGRYWSCRSLSELAAQLQTNEHNLNVILSRTRKKLKQYLYERGFRL